MKKLLIVLFFMFALFYFTGCAELETLEWKTLPDSVYELESMTEEQFTKSVSIIINGTEYTLAKALEKFPDDVTFVGFDLSQEGVGTIIVKYKSLSIFWSYQVVSGEVPVEVEEPNYDWYDDSATTYTLETVEDLYGFANIVNGKAEEVDADDFAGKTVKLADDIDLTGKIWVPIGEGVRKVVEEKQFADLEGKITRSEFKDYSSETDLISKLEGHTLEKNIDYDGYIFLGSHYFAKKVGTTWKYFYSDNDVVTGNYFAGTFDGQGHKIIGLSDIGYTPFYSIVYANSACVIKAYTFGLFGIVSGNVTIKNLTFENVQVVGAYYDTEVDELVKAEIDSVGAAVGYACGEGNLVIENVKVLSGFITGVDAVAGIVGRIYTEGNITLKNLQNRANITSDGHAGGIAGYVSLKENKKIEFINDYNYGNIISAKVSGGKAAGAILNYVGIKQDGTAKFDGCYNFGNITGYGDDKGMGLVNQFKEGKYEITNSYNYGTLK